MISRRTPLKRSGKAIPKKRARPRVRKEVVRLAGKELEALREKVYERDGGRCVYEGCGVTLPLQGSLFVRAHLSHIISRGAGGSDTMENTRILCRRHHLDHEHNCGGKPIKITKEMAKEL